MVTEERTVSPKCVGSLISSAGAAVVGCTSVIVATAHSEEPHPLYAVLQNVLYGVPFVSPYHSTTPLSLRRKYLFQCCFWRCSLLGRVPFVQEVVTKRKGPYPVKLNVLHTANIAHRRPEGAYHYYYFLFDVDMQTSQISLFSLSPHGYPSSLSIFVLSISPHLLLVSVRISAICMSCRLTKSDVIRCRVMITCMSRTRVKVIVTRH